MTTTTYRAAYIPAPQDSTGGGFVLTLPEHAALSDADLLAVAMPTLAEYNCAAEAVGGVTADAGDVVIGEWQD